MDNLNPIQRRQPARGAILPTGVRIPAHQPTPAANTPSPSTADSSRTSLMAPHQQTPYNQTLHMQEQQQLRSFWANQMQMIAQPDNSKRHSLPLARIKKIMKADPEVRMISATAPAIFAQACEMFIAELTLRSWTHTEQHKRRTLQRNDVANAILRTDIYDFLEYIISRNVEGSRTNVGVVPSCYCMFPQATLGGVEAVVGVQAAPVYTSLQQQASLQFMGPWSQENTDHPREGTKLKRIHV